MKIAVIGCGRWGSFLAAYSRGLGHELALWGRRGSETFRALEETRGNEWVSLREDIALTDDLHRAMEGAELALVAIAAQQFRVFLEEHRDALPGGATLLLCMKGLEAGTGKRLTQVAAETLGAAVPSAVLVGPGHVQDFTAGQPGCMIVSGQTADAVRLAVSALSGPQIRLYAGEDLIGAEVGAASKNVIGIAAGILDGLGAPGLKGALMTRGAFEIARLVRRMGGHEQTVYGLSHLGDYEATLFSPWSHNRAFGEALVKGEPYRLLAEGADTAPALQVLAAEYEVELPICTSVYRAVRGEISPAQGLASLFDRPGRFEFT
jgi:glycerol-3-phosphate dehydrogenase (NAD(P)+)